MRHEQITITLGILLLAACKPQSLRERAEAGDANAQFELGCALVDGRGLDKDMDMGIAWLKKAEKQGVNSATIMLKGLENSASGTAIDSARQAALAMSERAKLANTQTQIGGWASGLVRYKQAYGFYPNLSGGLYPRTDTAYLLEGDTGIALVMCLSGRNPDGSHLSPGGQGNRIKWNRNGETFVEFAQEDYANSLNGGSKPELRSRRGKRIYVAMDFNGDGRVSNISNIRLPRALQDASTPAGHNSRVLIFEEVGQAEEDTACFSEQ